MPVDSLIVILSTKTGNSTVFRRHSWAYRLSVVYIVVYNQSSISQMWRRGGSWQRCSYPSRNIFQMLAKWSVKRHGFYHRYASEILRISCTPFFKGMEWKHSHQHHQRRHTNRRNHLMYHPNHRIFLLFVVIIISVPIHAWTLAHFVSLFNVELDTNNQYNELTFPLLHWGGRNRSTQILSIFETGFWSMTVHSIGVPRENISGEHQTIDAHIFP